MALVIAKYVNGRPVDGFETWWDDVENALGKTTDELPLLRSIDPYIDLTLDTDGVLDLRAECEALLLDTDGRGRHTLERLHSLTTTVLSSSDSVLRFIGD